jgi:hypothetical protein
MTFISGSRGSWPYWPKKAEERLAVFSVQIPVFLGHFQNQAEDGLVGDWIVDDFEDRRDLLLQVCVLLERNNAARFAPLHVDIDICGSA